jgi:hypothetical protein
MFTDRGPRTAFAATLLAGGLVLANCGTTSYSDMDKAVADLAHEAHGKGYRVLDRFSYSAFTSYMADATVAIGTGCEGDIFKPIDDVTQYPVEITVFTNPQAGHQSVADIGFKTPDFPTHEELLKNPLIERACA